MVLSSSTSHHMDKMVLSSSIDLNQSKQGKLLQNGCSRITVSSPELINLHKENITTPANHNIIPNWQYGAIKLYNTSRGLDGAAYLHWPCWAIKCRSCCKEQVDRWRCTRYLLSLKVSLMHNQPLFYGRIEFLGALSVLPACAAIITCKYNGLA